MPSFRSASFPWSLWHLTSYVNCHLQYSWIWQGMGPTLGQCYLQRVGAIWAQYGQHSDLTLAWPLLKIIGPGLAQCWPTHSPSAGLVLVELPFKIIVNIAARHQAGKRRRWCGQGVMGPQSSQKNDSVSVTRSVEISALIGLGLTNIGPTQARCWTSAGPMLGRCWTRASPVLAQVLSMITVNIFLSALLTIRPMYV